MTKKAKKLVQIRKQDEYEHAYRLYMQSVSLKEIAERIGVSRVTLTKWKNDGEWEAKRASKYISLDTLMAKAMKRINEELDKGDEFSADAFAKAAKQIRELNKETPLDSVINTLTQFGDWIIAIAPEMKDINEDFVRSLIRYQDKYISEQIKKQG